MTSRRLAWGLALAILLLAGPAQAGLVQKAGPVCGTAASQPVTLPNTVAGNLIVVGATHFNATAAVTVSDPTNGSYSSVFALKTPSGNHTTTLNYKQNIAGGSVTITYAPASSSDVCVAAAEFDGVATTSALQSSNSSSGTGGLASSGAVTPTQIGSLMVAIEGQGASGAITENQGSEGFTLLSENESGLNAEPMSWVFRIATTTSSTSHTWSIPSGSWSAGIALFVPSGGGGGDTTPPSQVTGLQATAASDTQINLSWTAATDNVGVTGYRVERCQGAGCTNFAEIAQPTGVSLIDAGLTATTTYLYRVRAVDAANNLGTYSSSAQATTQAPSSGGWVPTGTGSLPKITVVEPTLKADGSALNDLQTLRLYWSLNGGAETMVEITASSASGGGTVNKNDILVPVLSCQSGTLSVSVSGVNPTNEGARVGPVTLPMNRLGECPSTSSSRRVIPGRRR